MIERVSGTPYDNLVRSLNPEGRTLVIVAAADLESVLNTVRNQRYEIARLTGTVPFLNEDDAPIQKRRYVPPGLVSALHDSMTARAE
jgi:hypothetical protein